jgi:DNA helicase-2/ATP-dependent DNA helicase PcrA
MKLKFTKEQQLIIHHATGVALINAGPGTGKSATLIGKIAWLLSQGIKPNEILILTYNREARRGFATRLRKELGPKATGVHVKTLHGYGLKEIKEHHKKLGFTLEPKVVTNSATSNAQRKLKRNQVDYDDMLTLPLQLFSEHPTILINETAQFSCLLVDELQDIKGEQAQLIELLAKHIDTTLLVGDLKQSIYSFIGAGVEHWNMLVDQLAHKHYSLTQSFRIPKASLPFVNAIAASFSDDKPLTSRVEGYAPSLYRFTDSDAQANYIAQTIKRLMAKSVDLTEIACLSKTNLPLQQLKLALEARGIDSIESNYSKSITKWLSVLRALISVSQWTASKHQGAMPKHSIILIFKLASIPLDQQDAVYKKIVLKGISGLKLTRSSKKSKKHQARLANIRSIRDAITEAARQSDTQAGVQVLIDALMTFVYRIDGNCKPLIQRELSRIKLQVRGLQWSEIKVRGLRVNVCDEGVTLSTIHGAKGKEWAYVFLLHVVEDEFKQGTDDYELFYTAITRHSWKLYLLETPRKNNSFTKAWKMYRKSNTTENSFIAPHVDHLKDCRIKSDI